MMTPEEKRTYDREWRANLPSEKREAMRERDRKRAAQYLAKMTPEQREARNNAMRENAIQRRANWTPEQREKHNEVSRKWRAEKMTPEQSEAHRETDRERYRQKKRIFDPSKIDLAATFREGAARVVKLSTRERDPRARVLCFARWGEACVGCGIEAVPWLQCHHLEAIAKGERLTGADDLRPLCPSCHSAVHYFGGGERKMLSIEELKILLRMIECGEHLSVGELTE